MWYRVGLPTRLQIYNIKNRLSRVLTEKVKYLSIFLRFAGGVQEWVVRLVGLRGVTLSQVSQVSQGVTTVTHVTQFKI